MDIDSTVIERAQQGDISAFEIIYKTYFQMVANVALRVVNRYEDAEDVAQEIFMVIHENLKKFRFESSLKTWIYRITVNTAINYSKKISKYHNNTVEYTEGLHESSVAEESDPGNNKEVNEKAVQTLLAAITPDQRACIVLRSVEGLSYQQIAESLKIPVNTVRSRIKRARETMLTLKKEVVSHEL